MCKVTRIFKLLLKLNFKSIYKSNKPYLYFFYGGIYIKLYFKQKIFSFRKRASIYDENGDTIFKIEGEFSFIPRIHIYDEHDNEVAFIKQKLFAWLPKFFVFINRNKVAEISKKFTWFKQVYNIKGINWLVKGNIWGYDFDLFSDKIKIAHVHKVWMSWGNRFEINVLNDENVVMVIAMVVALSCVNYNYQYNNS